MAKANSNPEEDQNSTLPSAAAAGAEGSEISNEADPGIFVPEGLLDSGASSQGESEQPHGQFDADEMEFETWMFDAGDGRGVVIPPEAHAASDTQGPGETVQVSGEAVPPPDFAAAATTAPSVQTAPAEPPPSFIQGSAQALPADIDSPAAVPAPARLSPENYPSTPSGWDDATLASVDDFSAVLLAMQGAPGATTAAPAEEHAPRAPRKSKPRTPKAAAETPQASTVPAVAPVAGEAADAVVMPPWQLGDMQEPGMTQPAEAVHDMAAYVGHEGQESQEAQAAEQPAEAAPEPANLPDFTWLNQSEVVIGEPPAQAEAAPPEQAPEQTEQVASEPEWSVPTDEGLPPWLLENAEQPSGELAQEAPAAEHVAEVGPAPAPEQDRGAMPVFEPVAVEAQPVAEAEVAEPLEAVTPFAPQGDVEQTQPAAEGTHGFSADEMEFESFMFDQGKAAPLPSLPNMGEFMPAVRAMESAVEPHAHGAGTPGLPGLAPMPGFMDETAAAVDTEARLQQESRQMAEAQAAQVQMESATPTEEELPFWLEDRSQPSGEPGALPSLTAEDLPALPLASFFDEAAEMQAESAASAAETAQEEAFDFSELPPIEPFDFSLIQAPEEEEELGFRTEDLTYASPGGAAEPLVVTANLDVLADLLGKDLPPGVALSPSGPDIAGAVGGNVMNQMGVPEPQGIPDPADYQSFGGPTPGRTPGWTATETSKLSGDTVAHLTGKIDPAEATQAPQAQPEQPESGADFVYSELDVSPFNITDLDLEDEETSTEFLETTSLNKQTTTTSFAQPEKILTGTLFGKAGEQEPDYWEAPDWMADMMDTGLIGTQGDDMDTSRFMGIVQAEEEDDGSLPTQHLVGRSTREAPVYETPAYEEQAPAPIFRARVSRFKQSDVLPADPFEDRESPQLTRPMAAPFDYAPQEPQYAPAAQAEVEVEGAQPAPMPEPPAPSRAPGMVSTATLTPTPSQMSQQAQPTASSTNSGSLTSGPLPALEGFHHLQEIVANRPNDVGARMALAVAYSQAGHFDHALYEFRRILQNRNVPMPMLGFIEDQINELEIEPASAPRFHQLRGDLYMKQGRYQEAIEEYNQIK